MKKYGLGTASLLALGLGGLATLAFAETQVPLQGPGFKPGAPSWFIEGSAADPMGPFPAPPPRGPRPPPPPPAPDFSNTANVPPGANGVGPDGLPPHCMHSPICQDNDANRFGGVADGPQRVAWKATTKWTYSYPFQLPAGGGDVTGVGVDGQDNYWVWQRNQPGKPALFKFGPDKKLLFAVPADVTDQTMPFRGHGMCVSTDGRAIVLNEYGQWAKEFSPDGKLIMQLGVKGHRGDWDEAKGQRLLWEPVTCGFAPNGDIYIFEGHGDESPNDMGSSDPTNTIGVARVLHLDKDGKFLNQWYGDHRGPGKFNSAHGSAIDPATGDVWVGDREDDRIVVYTANGHFLRSIQMRNLICALYFDNHPGPRFGTLWLGTGMDGQVIRIDRNGNTLEVAGGNRKGGAEGQFNEATNMSSDSHGDLMVADTQQPRATLLSPPAKKLKK
ncbi:MAG TPA: hypothetical protein VMU59_14965 [Caulobacteraceae bacterium]|nr:hypothetical protein [Caulobacteraceae bacterium]